jgi:hypothetical protein
LPVRSPRSDQLLRHRIARLSGQQVSAFPFEVDSPDAVEADLWPASGSRGGIQFLVFEIEVPQEWKRLANVAVIIARHPQDAGAPVELLRPQAVPLGPQHERPGRHFDVPPRGSIDGSNDAGFSPRARAGVARPPGIQQSHPHACPAQVQGRPSAEGPRANDGDMDR